MEAASMKRALLILAALAALGIFCGGVADVASGDENYYDHSEEHSSGPGEPPDDGMAREEPRTRFKDR
jgi:hypothetical protein